MSSLTAKIEASAKDYTREKRDAKGKDCSDMPVDNDEKLPPMKYDWTRDFLCNRSNKKSLVQYLREMLLLSRNPIKEGKMLYVTFEKEVWRVGTRCEANVLANLRMLFGIFGKKV